MPSESLNPARPTPLISGYRPTAIFVSQGTRYGTELCLLRGVGWGCNHHDNCREAPCGSWSPASNCLRLGKEALLKSEGDLGVGYAPPVQALVKPGCPMFPSLPLRVGPWQRWGNYCILTPCLPVRLCSSTGDSCRVLVLELGGARSSVAFYPGQPSGPWDRALS